MPLLFLNYEEKIDSSPSVNKLSLSENVELLFPSSFCQDIHRNIVVLFEGANLIEREGKF